MISEDKQIKMFGTTIEILDAAIEESDDPLMLAMSIMSDAQQAMLYNQEEARQYINRAKHVVDGVRRKRLGR